MSQNAAYQPISLGAAWTIAGSGEADFALYLPAKGKGEPVLYRERASSLSMPDIGQLRDNGIESFLVRAHDLWRCEQLIESGLEEGLRSSDIPPQAKAGLLHRVGSGIARELVANREEGLDLKRANNYVNNVIVGVQNDPDVSGYLLQMAQHEHSTASHMMVVSALAVMLGAEVYGPDSDALAELGLAGMLHDLGKLSIDAKLLNKQGPLTPGEIQMIQQHPIESVRLLADDAHVSREVRQIILQHHERVDGKGYPIRICGAALSQDAKILSVADAFHAMIGRRSYRRSMPAAEASRMIEREAGTQFDEEIVNCWTNLFGRSWGRVINENTTVLLENPEELPTRHEHRTFVTPAGSFGRRMDRATCREGSMVRCFYAGRLHDVSSSLEEFTAPVQDLSRNGLCIYSPHPTYRGEVIHFLVNRPNRAEWLRGTVMWCRQHSDQVFKTGIRFVERITESQAREKVPVRSLLDLAPMEWKPYSLVVVREGDAAPVKQEPMKQKSHLQSVLEALDNIAAMTRINSEAERTTLTLSMSGEAEVRLKVVDLLARIRSGPALRMLRQMQEDPDDDVRERATCAAAALGLIKPADEMPALAE